ncbi:DMT family transporter [Moraxella nasovis]|uniref:EamA family transporter n=1 Tax=Moraxella nasovis TaxID=2904121 RepID=UPI001F60BBD6|nr:EamA family transporter [Moraxella nasovis]UNU72797.1 DMT family transporter [Moraxella nasovis]
MQIPASFAWVAILCLVLLPTIGGFYFTTKAVELGEASKVQIIETSDPLFATLFAFIFFGDLLGFYGYIGALLIFVGLLTSIKS